MHGLQVCGATSLGRRGALLGSSPMGVIAAPCGSSWVSPRQVWLAGRTRRRSRANYARTLGAHRGAGFTHADVRPLHVCFLCSEYPPASHGGVGVFTQTLGRALVEKGHRATVVGLYTGDEVGESSDHGVRVVRLPHTRIRGLGLPLHLHRVGAALRRIHREHAIDVVEGPELSLALVPRGFSAIKVIRMSGGHHFFADALGSAPRTVKARLERMSFAKAGALCAVSRFVAEKTRTLLGLGAQKIQVLPNPVDTDRFRPGPDEGEEDGLLVFVGTVCAKKGVRELLGAMPTIAKTAPHVRLLIVGRDSRDSGGGSFTQVLRGTMSPEIAERVTFTGARAHEELPLLLSRASICVLPSHMESFGITIAEAMAAGKAVVTGRLGPSPELVEDGSSGVLCDPHSAESIASAVLELLSDDEHRRRMGAEARRRAVERFSLQVLVPRNVEFYRRCMQARNGQSA